MRRTPAAALIILLIAAALFTIFYEYDNDAVGEFRAQAGAQPAMRESSAQPSQELATTNERIIYVYGSGLVARKDATGVTYQHQDYLSSNRFASDSSGRLVSRNVQEPYGVAFEDLGTSSALANDYSFTGKEQDDRLYYFGARYYDPRTARFVSVDPVPTGASPYAYAANNPLRFVDPDGMDEEPSQQKFLLETAQPDLAIVNPAFPDTAQADSLIAFPDSADTPRFVQRQFSPLTQDIIDFLRSKKQTPAWRLPVIEAVLPKLVLIPEQYMKPGKIEAGNRPALQQEALEAFIDAHDEILEKTGYNIRIIRGIASYHQQELEGKRNKQAAKPGRSAHELGLAIDVFYGTGPVVITEIREILKKHGFDPLKESARRGTRDPEIRHYEYVGPPKKPQG